MCDLELIETASELLFDGSLDLAQVPELIDCCIEALKKDNYVVQSFRLLLELIKNKLVGDYRWPVDLMHTFFKIIQSNKYPSLAPEIICFMATISDKKKLMKLSLAQ